MELTILTSKKGTRVVKASALHRALGLPDHHYQANVRHWLRDVYQFADGIRKPEGLQDYARSSKTKAGVVHEYYLNLELARLITLASKSKVKQAMATKLSKEEAVYPDRVTLTAEQALALLEQTKAMTRISCQLAAEERHLKAYTRRRGSADYWNRFRVDHVVHTTMEELRQQLDCRGVQVARTSRLRDLLLRFDSLECIRIGIIDHYAAQGYSLDYAGELGKLARELAATMKLEVHDDRKGESLFTPTADTEVLQKLRRVAA